MRTATVEIPTHEQVLNFVGAPRKMLIGGRVDQSCVGENLPDSDDDGRTKESRMNTVRAMFGVRDQKPFLIY